MWTDLQLVRLAAYIEGEGSIQVGGTQGVRKRNPRSHRICVMLSNSDPRMPFWCYQNFGGNFCRVPLHEKNPNWKCAWVWNITGRKAAEALRACLPHFISKREQAEIAVRYRSTVAGSRQPLPEEIYEQRESLIVEMKMERGKDWKEFTPPKAVND